MSEPGQAVAAIELSVVIPAYNAATTIIDQLRALDVQQWNGRWEVVVADNGSTDQTVKLVEEFARSSQNEISIVDASGKRGAATARNIGVANSRGRHIAFCDADDIVGSAWVSVMGDALRDHEFVTGPQEQELLNPSWVRNVYGSSPSREMQTFAGIFPFGPTANLGLRRDLFDRVGGFNVEIEVFEDLDLCLRIWLVGVSLRFVSDLVVHYRYRHEIKALWRQAVAYGRAAPAIALTLAKNGRRRPGRWTGAKNWLWLVRKLPTLRHRPGRARWVAVAGGAVGRLSGSVRARSLMF